MCVTEQSDVSHQYDRKKLAALSGVNVIFPVGAGLFVMRGFSMLACCAAGLLQSD